MSESAQSKREMPMVIVRMSRFSSEIILMVSIISFMLSIYVIPLLNSVH